MKHAFSWYFVRLMIVMVVTSPLLVTNSVFAQGDPKADLHAMEIKYRENGLSAKKSYAGAPVRFQVFVTKVDEKNGKPLLQTNIIYFSDGMQLYCDVWLNPKTIKTALSLKSDDCVEVSGTLRKREVLSKDEVQYHGYISSVYNGSGGGGTVNGGTVTRSWSVYTIDNATVKVVQTAAAKAKAEANAAAKQEQVLGIWKDAIGLLDVKMAQQAIDKGLVVSYVDAALHQANTIDPDVTIYDQVVTFYEWCLHQNGVDVGNAISDALTFKRPKLFQKIVEGGGVNVRFVFPNGDNVLHFLIKDRAIGYRADIASKSLKLFFSDDDAEIIEILCRTKEAQGLGDFKDKYGITPKEYIKKGNSIDSFSTPSKAFIRIRDAINAL